MPGTKNRGTKTRGDERRRRRKPSRILSLPVEIIHRIRDINMETHATVIIALSMTCKALHLAIGLQKHNSLQLALNRDHREVYDNWALMYCAGCRALRPRRDHELWCQTVQHVVNPHHTKVSRDFFHAHARLILDHEGMTEFEGFGEKHLERCSWAGGENGLPFWRQCPTVKIIETEPCISELYMKVDHLWTGSIHKFAAHIVTGSPSPYWLCAHTHIGQLERARRSEAHNSRRHLLRAPFEDYKTSCNSCRTDFTLSIEEKDVMETAYQADGVRVTSSDWFKGWDVTVSAYHRLGHRWTSPGCDFWGSLLNTANSPRTVSYSPSPMDVWEAHRKKLIIELLKKELREKQMNLRNNGRFRPYC